MLYLTLLFYVHQNCVTCSATYGHNDHYLDSKWDEKMFEISGRRFNNMRKHVLVTVYVTGLSGLIFFQKNK